MLDFLYDFVWADGGQDAHKKVAIVHVALQGDDIKGILLTDLGYQLAETSLQPIYQENLSTIACAKDQVIADKGKGSRSSSVNTFHVYIIA